MFHNILHSYRIEFPYDLILSNLKSFCIFGLNPEKPGKRNSFKYIRSLYLTIYKMKEKNKLIRVYTGTEGLVYILKSKLEEIGIPATVRKDSNDSFLGSVPSAIDLYIQQSDYEKAESIINEFIQTNKG